MDLAVGLGLASVSSVTAPKKLLNMGGVNFLIIPPPDVAPPAPAAGGGAGAFSFLPFVEAREVTDAAAEMTEASSRPSDAPGWRFIIELDFWTASLGFLNDKQLV